MTKKRIHNNYTIACSSVRGFSCLALFCALFTLTGCGKFDLPTFGSENAKIKKERNELRNEISYVDEKRPKSGANPKNMFGRNLRNDSERMDRLERAVQNMRNEFDSVKPSIKRLSALEGEIQRLISELKQLNGEEVDIAPPPSARKAKAHSTQKAHASYKPVPNKNYQKKTVPPVQNGVASIYDVRIGEHPGRTRIVMDVNAKTNFTVDIDNNENIMIVELPKANWSASKTKSFSRSNFISSYNVETSGNGHILILQLKKNAKITYKDDLKGSSGQSRRLVIDLTGA